MKKTKIWEVGVGEAWQSRSSHFDDNTSEFSLFEPNPISFAQIQEKFGNKENFKLFNFALGSQTTKKNLFLAGASSYIEGVDSPEIKHNPNASNEKTKILIDIVDIREIDTGDIDILLIDAEGSEFDIIKNLISRPQKIIVEMFSFGVGYKNPNFDEIIKWMNINNYITSDDKGEDFVFNKVS